MDNKLREIQMQQQEKCLQEMEALLYQIKSKPRIYSSKRMRFLREFVSLVQRDPVTYPSRRGDDTVQLAPLLNVSNSLTCGFVQALTELKSGSSVCDSPVLSVLTKDTKHHDDRTGRQDPQRVKLTEMELIDGDGQQIHARLNIALTETGRLLRRGDRIRLDLFSEVMFRANSSSPRLPALFISALSRLGSEVLDDDDIAPEISACTRTLASEQADSVVPEYDGDPIDPRKDAKPKCTDEHRFCAVYGLRFLGCVCDVIPVADCNLATLKEDCYFATDDLAKMSNSHKRNMIFWWYATNVFSIVGKHKIGRLPLCLEYAVREAYPNPADEPYKGFGK